MSGIIIKSGNYLNRDSVKSAVEKISHRGSVTYSYIDEKVNLYLLGDNNFVEENDTLLAIYLNSKQALYSPAENYSVLTNREKLRDLISWDKRQIIIYNKRERILQIIQGRLCPTPFYFWCSGPNIFGASEIKAFADINEIRSVHLLPGCSFLDFNILKASCKIENVSVTFDRNGNKTLPYEETVALCRNLVIQSVENLIEDFENPPPVCLSGGLDSCIIAYLVKKLCDTCKAFTVWFQIKKGSLPSDLIFARSFAEKYGIELHEISVSKEELLMYMEDSIFTGETSLSKEIEDALYYYPLSRALSEFNYTKAFHGAGSDRLFAGFKEYLEIYSQEEFWNYYLHKLFSQGQASLYEKHFLKNGIKLLLPYKDIKLIKNLWFIPKEYKIRESNGLRMNKAVLRDAFKDFLPEEFIMREKGIPRNNNNLKMLLNEIFKNEERKKEFYKNIYNEKLKTVNCI